MTSNSVTAFNQLALTRPLLKALDEVGYETPSPIQAQTIPLLLEGKDVLGQAQTGTGKTAAFALPILSKLDLKQKDPQVLVLAPTRELAIQVAEAFQKYASHVKGFHVLPVYGGQDYNGQIRALKRGVHVVVGTPGRVMDHMRRGTLKLESLSTMVLDEADEMLRMGFIDDVEWILEQTPADRQTALFSATMPAPIRRIANRYLNKPTEITIKVKTATAETIRQRYWVVSGLHKLDALTRILEAESFDAMLVFVRTKTATLALSERLAARGYATAALNGDIPQKQRERTIEQLKKGKLDILVATDVAARGLDVERISHVVNYDIPYDTEAYIHRIGRTGRAGRQGDAILFVAPREKRLLQAIEKATNKKIEMMELPSMELINNQRMERFKQRITDTLESEDLTFFTQLIEQYQHERSVSSLAVAAALAKLLQGSTSLLLENKPNRKIKDDIEQYERSTARKSNTREAERRSKKAARPDEAMERFRVEVGKRHKVKPAHIVGAITNEAGIDSRHIGHIEIYDAYSLVDLPEGMPKEVFKHLKKVWVFNQQLKISRLNSENQPEIASKRSKSKTKPGKKSKAKTKSKTKAQTKTKTKNKRKTKEKN